MSEVDKKYIGDSVYVVFDGNNLILTTENGGPNRPSNCIMIEPEVWEALMLYVKQNIDRDYDIKKGG